MNELIEILEDIVPGVDYENCAFDVEVAPVELVAENFNSAKSLWAMITRLKGDE